jgi:hypothetical protein
MTGESKMTKALDQYSEANPERFRMIVAAIAAVADNGHLVSIAALRDALPKDFALDGTLDHVAEIVAAESGVSATMDREEAGDGSVDDRDFLDSDDKGEAPDALRQRVVDLDRRAADLRGQLYSLRTQLTTARGVLGDSISAFVHGHGPKVTQQDNIRAHLAASLAERAANARGDDLPPIPQAGPSTLDRQALYSGHATGDASDFVRKQMQNGGFRRGSMPASVQGAATRLRVPSAQ